MAPNLLLQSSVSARSPWDLTGCFCCQQNVNAGNCCCMSETLYLTWFSAFNFLTNWFILYIFLRLVSLLRTNHLSSTTGFWVGCFFFQVTKICQGKIWILLHVADQRGDWALGFNFQLIHPSNFSLKSMDMDWKDSHRAIRKTKMICKIQACEMSKRATASTGKM